MKNMCRKKLGIFVAILMVCDLCAPAGYAGATEKTSFHATGNLQSAPTAKVKLSAAKATVVIGSTLTLTVKNLDDSKVHAIKWKSNRTSIAKVNQKGVVTPVKAGTTTIKCTITYKDRTTQTLSCTVTVKKRVKATAININNTEKEASLKVGERVTLKATLSPVNTMDQIYWFSSNKAVATVGLTSGKVTAKKEGTVVITAKDGLDKKGATAKTNKVVTEIKIEVKSEDAPLKATDESFFTWEERENGVVITGYKENLPKDVVIPEKINGVTVVEIGNWAFLDCDVLTSITIPNSVTNVGYNAFYNCNNLTSITIPNSVISIGAGAFIDCSALTSITIPNSVTSIGDSAFLSCSGLKKIQVAKENKIYDSRENSNAIIEMKSNCLIMGCENTIIPDSVTSIGNSAFSGCSGLKSITIPDSVTRIGDRAFFSCSDLTNITIPGSVTSIGNSAFTGCSSLTSITIPNSVTIIGNSAFSGCRGLTSIAISNSVTSINDSTFRGCSRLTNIAIPDSVTSIGDCVFYGCVWLTNITIPDSVTNIGGFVFSGCDGLTNITIPNSVTSIGDFAFSGCIGLTSITIPNSVTSIGNSALQYCYGLEICGQKGSFAQKYVKENNILFVEE